MPIGINRSIIPEAIYAFLCSKHPKLENDLEWIFVEDIYGESFNNFNHEEFRLMKVNTFGHLATILKYQKYILNNKESLLNKYS